MTAAHFFVAFCGRACAACVASPSFCSDCAVAAREPRTKENRVFINPFKLMENFKLKPAVLALAALAICFAPPPPRGIGAGR